MNQLLPTTIAGSLPKPSWLAETEKLWPRWRLGGAELEEAKRSIISSFALSLENPAGIVNSWMAVKYYGLAPDYWDHYSDQIAKVDADAVQRMAKKYIDLDHLQIVVVGDAQQVREAVAKYGAVEVFDADGKPTQAKPGAAPGGR